MPESFVTLSEEKMEHAAYVLKAVAHPVRVGIIDMLTQKDELSVSTITKVLRIEQSVVSHHLAKMRDTGIVKIRREGRNVFYRLTDDTITDIIHCIGSCKKF